MVQNTDRNAIIRGLYASGERTLQEIADEYGVSKARIGQITKGVKKAKKIKYFKIKHLPPIGYKRCSDCKNVKSTNSFHKDSGQKDSLCSRCKECATARTTQNNRRKLGVSRLDYLSMLDSQDGSCAICQTKRDNNGKELALDHDHTTGKVRGLLCSNCNLMLGYAHDSTEVLKNGVIYLLKG